MCCLLSCCHVNTHNAVLDWVRQTNHYWFVVRSFLSNLLNIKGRQAFKLGFIWLEYELTSLFYPVVHFTCFSIRLFIYYCFQSIVHFRPPLVCLSLCLGFGEFIVCVEESVLPAVHGTFSLSPTPSGGPNESLCHQGQWGDQLLYSV